MSLLKRLPEGIPQEMQQHLCAWSSGRCRDGNALRLEEVLLGPAKASETRQKSLVVSSLGGKNGCNSHKNSGLIWFDGDLKR